MNRTSGSDSGAFMPIRMMGDLSMLSSDFRASLWTMKIATYNVNGVNGRLPVLLRWLQQAQPDVVALQELKAPDEKFPAEPIRALGYEVAWHGQSRWNGVALLSKVGEIHETRRGLPGDPEDIQSRYIEAAI